MLKVIIIEGARGGGKSTVARLLRNSIEGSTLINLTGFKESGPKGLEKIEAYYDGVCLYLEALAASHQDFTVIFDRTFFSEMVYAPLYKDYDFTSTYNRLCRHLLRIAGSLEVYLFTVGDNDVLGNRLMRDKVELFGSIEESVHQSLIQQSGYQKLFVKFEQDYKDNLHMEFLEIDTAGLTPELICKIIMRG